MSFSALVHAGPAILACVSLLTISAFAQDKILVSGAVQDAETQELLQYANVHVEGTSRGTTTNADGRFCLYLERGVYTIVGSQVGYKSERRTLEVAGDRIELSLQLVPAVVELPEVLVMPQENPALNIIRHAIEARKRRNARLDNYSLTSHSKLVVKASDMKGLAVNSLSDSSFTAIMETQTDAYWAKPDKYKEIVKARKQSAFIPAQSNIIISSFFIADFSSDVLNLNNKSPIVGPISEAGFNNYEYRLAGTTAMDGMPISVIEISPRSDDDPLLKGTLWIADDTYALTRVDVELNDAARPTFFKRLAFKQNFRLFENEFWMPTDVVVSGDIEISLIVKIKVKIDGLSVLQDYAINTMSNEDVFDRTRIKVMTEADMRDSAYWTQHQVIPNSLEEIEEYRKSDSLKIVFEERRNQYGVMNTVMGKTLSFDEARLQIPGLFNLYSFNRVEGNNLYLPLSIKKPFGEVQNIAASAGYGFSDKRWKYGLDARVNLFGSREISISGSLYDRLGSVDEEHEPWDRLSTTLSNLLYKYDHRDYYYVKGWEAGAHGDVSVMFPVDVSVKQRSFYNAARNTNWSLIGHSFDFRENPPINEGTITSVGATLTFDARDIIDNAGVIQRFNEASHVPTIGVRYNAADLGGEKFNYTVYSAGLQGRFESGRIGTTQYRVAGSLSDGKLPTQEVFNLPGSDPYTTDSWRFRSLGFREFGGDRRVAAFLEHNFGDQVFRWLHIPLLKNSGWGLVLFASGEWATMSDGTKSLQTVPLLEAKTPFYEAGFGIDRIFLLFRVDFAWRLNHFREGENFFVGVSTPILK